MVRGRALCCALLFALISKALVAQGVITTIAGLDPSFTGDGRPATNVPLGYVNGVATDSAGNVYFTDPLEHLVLQVSPDGTLSVIAGNGIAAYSGDGGPATSAAIAAADSPEQYAGVAFEDGLGGIAVDKQGNVYFADSHRVRQVAPDGTISTVAGGGRASPGDGGPATQASLGIVTGVALDAAGDLYFCEKNRIRKMTADGTLATFAGTGVNGFAGDNGPATAALLSQPLGLAFDAQGNLYVADGDVVNFPSHIRKIDVKGNITTVAGGGSTAPANGVAPLNTDLSYASGLAVDSTSALYVYAPYAGALIKFSANGSTLVTSTQPALFIPNQKATNVYLAGLRPYDNSGIAFDASGNLYVAESHYGHLCKIDATGVLTAIAGNGSYGFGGDGNPADGALIQGPTGMTQTPDGTVYFLDTLNQRVRGIAPSGIISTVLGPGTFPFGRAEVIAGIASDSNGSLYLLFAHRLIKLTNGTVQNIISGTGTTGDSGPALSALIQTGAGLARDAAGNLYVADSPANQIFKVTPDGTISAFAGNGTQAVSPDGAAASTSAISGPSTLLADGQGGLYFVEAQRTALRGSVVRYITPDGHLKTIAGNGKGGFSGDGGPAVQAGIMLQAGAGLALDASGNLYIADGFNYRVRVVTPGGTIHTFAGTGTPATEGDGGLAQNASFYVPQGLLFDAEGDLLISDVAGNRIREVLAAQPPIMLSKTQLSFSGKAGGAQTPPQKLTLAGPVSGLAFSIGKSAGSDWLLLSATVGSTPQVIDVRADPSNLAAGNYRATLTVMSPLANPVNSAIDVTLQVTPGAPPKLAIQNPALSFTFPRNPTSSLTQTVNVSNAGTGTLAFSVRAQTVAGNWLSVSPGAGSATPQTPAAIAVTSNPAGLASGTYTGTVTIASSTSGETATVPVNLTVSTLDQAISLSHPALSFIAVAGGGVVPPDTFAVTNRGRGSMNFTVSTRTLSGGQQWLTATPRAGSSSGAAAPVITVTVNQTGLAPGVYYGLVRVDSAAAANTPQVMTVVLLVQGPAQDPGPVIEPSEIVFSTVQGAPPPGSASLLVYNVSGTPQTYVSNVTASNPNGQIVFRPQNSTLTLNQPTRVVVQPLTSGLAAGVYDDQLTMQFSDGIVRTVGIRTIISPAPGSPAIKSNGARLATIGPTGCVPSQLVPVITTLGQSFGVPAAWPVALKAEVRDDCGNELDAGSVNVSFSNGDAPLNLQSLQNGLWNATWQSGHNTGAVTITATASDPARNLVGTRQVTGGLGTASAAPVLAAAVNGASFAANAPLAPGSIISLFGQNLANGTAGTSGIPLDTTIAGATVVMAGNALPLIFGSNGQINAVISAGINTNTSQQILVQRDNTLSVPISVDVGPTAPAVFPYPGPGDPATQGAVVNAITYVVAHPGTPATAGDVLAIFCTGLGAVDHSVPDGAASPASPLANTMTAPTVTIGGINAPVAFSGLTPGFVGLYQIDAAVPKGITPGNQVPLVVSIAGQTSPAATIAVK